MWVDTLLSAVQASVPVPEPTEQALRYYRSGNLLWIVDTLGGLLIPGVILFTGFSARIRSWAERVTHRRSLVVMLYVALFVVLTTLIALPLSFYEEYVRQHAYGLSNQTLGKWVSDTIKGLLVGMVAGSLVALIPYTVLRRSPRRWWLWTWLAALPVLVFVFVISPVVVAPLFNKFGPLEDKQLEAQILAEANQAGIRGSRIFEVNKSVDTKAIDAYVTGFGSSKRIVLYDTIIKKLDSREILFALGHEMGHYVLHHVVIPLFGSWLLIGCSLWAVHRMSGGLIARYHDRFGFDRLDDPASLPLLLLLASAISFVLAPLQLAVSRHLEHEADRFGLELTRDNHSAATAFVKLQQENLEIPRPGPIYTFFRASHPSLGERIDFSNSYRPWATGQPLKYGDHFVAE